MLKTVNPATGKTIETYPYIENERLFALLTHAHQAFLEWRKGSFEERRRLFLQVKALLLDEQARYAQCITDEMGKVYAQSLAEIQKCAWLCEFYAEQGADFLADERIQTEATDSFITYQPLGVVFSIMPWNFPFWQLFRFAVPAMMAGNGVVLKHASHVTGCALLMESLFKNAGFPEHLFTTLLISHTQAEQVIAHPCIQAVTFTGGSQAGKVIAKTAGENLKKTVLELGGSDPYIVLADADLEIAVEACVASKLNNAGQSCIAAKRFIVVESVYPEFLAAFIQKLAQAKLGDPNDPETTIGPLASLKQRNELHQQVNASIKKGAQCVLGGEIPVMEGAYYPPTILVNVKKGMPAYDEEMFGPVASIICVKDTEEAIQVANDSCYGLGGAIFTQDEALGRKIAREAIETGSIAVNQFLKSDPRMPFGGVKESGYGRELSYVGIREFTNLKSVVVA